MPSVVWRVPPWLLRTNCPLHGLCLLFHFDLAVAELAKPLPIRSPPFHASTLRRAARLSRRFGPDDVLPHSVGVRRFVLVSAMGAGDSENAVPFQAMDYMRPFFLDKSRAELYLRESGTWSWVG